MLGVLEIGFSEFLSFVGGSMWVLCGGFVRCVILVLSFCRCVGCEDVCICVFFSSASACAEVLHDVL